MNKQRLADKIWESANRMYSKIEVNEYKDYILLLLSIDVFLKQFFLLICQGGSMLPYQNFSRILIPHPLRR